jgi:hypothetical protein
LHLRLLELGARVSPPMKYLSESHLNSLGICLFLASAQLFNTAAGFLVLDDIVTSFDHGHRRRLLRLIKEEFAEWQIILLTHERFWFELIQKEFGTSGGFVTLSAFSRGECSGQQASCGGGCPGPSAE